MFFRNKNSHYKEEVKSRNRLGEIAASIKVLLDQVKGQDDKTYDELRMFAEEINGLFPRADAEKEEKKIKNALEDLSIEINRSIKKEDFASDKLASALEEVGLAISKRKHMVASYSTKEEKF